MNGATTPGFRSAHLCNDVLAMCCNMACCFQRNSGFWQPRWWQLKYFGKCPSLRKMNFQFDLRIFFQDGLLQPPTRKPFELHMFFGERDRIRWGKTRLNARGEVESSPFLKGFAGSFRDNEFSCQKSASLMVCVSFPKQHKGNKKKGNHIGLLGQWLNNFNFLGITYI